MAFSFGGDSVCAANTAGIGSSDVRRLATPSLKPSRRFIDARGVSTSELSALPFMEIVPSLFGVCDPKQRLRALHWATRQKTPSSKINSVAARESLWSRATEL